VADGVCCVDAVVCFQADAAAKHPTRVGRPVPGKMLGLSI
jgi:hypothetical protein